MSLIPMREVAASSPVNGVEDFTRRGSRFFVHYAGACNPDLLDMVVVFGSETNGDFTGAVFAKESPLPPDECNPYTIRLELLADDHYVYWIANDGLVRVPVDAEAILPPDEEDKRRIPDPLCQGVGQRRHSGASCLRGSGRRGRSGQHRGHGQPPFLRRTTSCPAVADVNIDGIFDITDPSYLINFLFLGGPAPEKSPVQCRPESEAELRPVGRRA